MADYHDPAAAAEARVADLLERMTLDEKLAQLGCVWSTQLVEDDAFSPERARELLRHGTGHITRIGASTGLRPAESAAFANAIQRLLVEETRLGIAAIIHEESTAGFTASDATQYPPPIRRASADHAQLIEPFCAIIRSLCLVLVAWQTLPPLFHIA